VREWRGGKEGERLAMETKRKDVKGRGREWKRKRSSRGR